MKTRHPHPLALSALFIASFAIALYAAETPVTPRAIRERIKDINKTLHAKQRQLDSARRHIDEELRGALDPSNLDEITTLMVGTFRDWIRILQIDIGRLRNEKRTLLKRLQEIQDIRRTYEKEQAAAAAEWEAPDF